MGKRKRKDSWIAIYKRVRKTTAPPVIVTKDERQKILDAITERELDEDQAEEDTEA